MISPETIVKERMYQRDAFSQWLGIRIEYIAEGHCTVSMTIRKEMLNGFGIAHGGISYSLADSALAFASNTYGKHAVSIETSISHTVSVTMGEKLIAEAKPLHRSRKTSVYEVRINNASGVMIAYFKGTVYHRSGDWT